MHLSQGSVLDYVQGSVLAYGDPLYIYDRCVHSSIQYIQLLFNVDHSV